MATVKLIHLTKRFGKQVVAVKDMSLEVHDKEFLVLLGPSGCGKTTTMRMIAGLEEVTDGAVLIDGVDVTDMPPRKRNVSMVFQNYAVWPHMTVYENIAYPLKLKKMSKSDIDRIVNSVAEMTSISELLQRLPAQLSGGQRQRVAVARAIAVEPKVFLMDEPLSNLDAKLRVAMRTELKAIHAKTGATTIFVTHDQSEAMSMADRIVIMRHGEIEQIGTPDDVYNHSANMFVADFIGMPPTNFFEAEIVHKNGDLHLISPHFDFIPTEHIASLLKDYDKKQVVIGIRPESILLVDEKDALFSAQALVTEPQGSHQIVSFQRNDGKIVKIVAPAQTKVKAGETINIAFKHDAMRFYDPETTLAIEV